MALCYPAPSAAGNLPAVPIQHQPADGQPGVQVAKSGRPVDFQSQHLSAVQSSRLEADLGQGRMVLVHSCNPKALQDGGPITPLVSPQLQAVVVSSSPRAPCAAQAHRYGLQPSQAPLPMRVALLSLPQLRATRPFSTPRDQQRTHPAPQAARDCEPQAGTAGTPSTQRRVPGWGAAVQGQQGKEGRAGQEEAWGGRLQAHRDERGRPRCHAVAGATAPRGLR